MLTVDTFFPSGSRTVFCVFQMSPDFSHTEVVEEHVEKRLLVPVGGEPGYGAWVPGRRMAVPAISSGI